MGASQANSSGSVRVKRLRGECTLRLQHNRVPMLTHFIMLRLVQAGSAKARPAYDLFMASTTTRRLSSIPMDTPLRPFVGSRCDSFWPRAASRLTYGTISALSNEGTPDTLSSQAVQRDETDAGLRYSSSSPRRIVIATGGVLSVGKAAAFCGSVPA